MDPVLGVDLGTTYTAAAVIGDVSGKAEMIGLGNRTAEIPSVLLFRADGEFLVGEPAERRAFGEPDRVARQFKRRLGDATPLLLGGSPFSPEALLGRLLKYVVARATEQRGSQFAATVVCHPANFGPYRMELLGQAAKMAELEEVHFVPEPVAAAVHYTEQAKLDPGEIVVVYDFGGGTFDVAVLRRTDDAFEVVGTPAGLEHLGGLDLDEAVFGHVAQSVGASLTELDPADPAVVAAVVRLREECKAAKEALSSDTDTSIPVLLPGIQTEVRLTRAEFEAMILPSIIDTVATTTRAIRDAGLEPADVGRILLVGGSARVPLVSQLLTEELGRPIVIDAHPKHAIALGAARWGAIEVAAGIAGASAAEAPVVAAAGAAVDTDPVAPPPEDITLAVPVVEVDETVQTPLVDDTPVIDEAPPAEAEPEPVAAAVVAEPVVAPEPAPAPKIAPAPPKPKPTTGRAGIPRAALAGAAALVLAIVAFVVMQAGGGDGEKTLEPISARVVVDGDQAWTDTEITVAKGDKITIEASGQVFHAEEQSSGPDGSNQPIPVEFNVIEDVKHNALIGKFTSSGEPFFIGGFRSFRAEEAGRLFLGVNDTGVDNNSGRFDVEIEVERA